MLNLLLLLAALLGITLFGPIILMLQVGRKIYRKESVSSYFIGVAVSIDQLGGTIIYGEEDWTISSLAYYQASYKDRNKWFMHFINFLFRDKLHCKKSFEDEYEVLKNFPK